MCPSADHQLPPMPHHTPGRDRLGQTPRPAHDPAVRALYATMGTDPLTAEQIPASREEHWLTPEDACARFGLDYHEVTCPGFGGTAITLGVYRRRGDDSAGPGIVVIHGGGMVNGDHYAAIIDVADTLQRHGGRVITVDYRLAPEHPAPIPVEDCHAALVWVLGHAEELGIDATRLVLAGGSAGGGLAAGAALLHRDRGGEPLLGLMLGCPMLDDRNDSTSIRQFERSIAWSGASNEVGWTALLGERRGTEQVSPYDAPARATWLGGLPPTLIYVGSADPFRSEDVAFAEAIWRDGGDCELHVMPGGCHGYEVLASGSAIADTTVAARAAWFARILG